jgi:RNA polymerase sigma-32 factor
MASIEDPGLKKGEAGFIRSAMAEKLLSREDEHALAVAWRVSGDEDALHRLVTAHTRLVVAVAAKFRRYGLSMADLIQEGNIGLMKAAARFDPGREVRFSTYASWWIKAEMQDFVLRNWSIVRTGTTSSQKSLFFNLRRLRARIMAETASEELTAEGRARIAKELKVSPQDVADMEQRFAAPDRSLDAPMASGEEEGGSFIDMLEDESASPEQVVIGLKDAETRSAWLRRALEELTPRERRIISERRLTEEGVTLDALGAEFGVSKERVRQLEARALDKLRAHLVAHLPDPRDFFVEDR